MKYKAWTLHNFKGIEQISKLSTEEIFDIEVVGHILPFRVSNYVVDELINWEDHKEDPFFILTFPQKDMVSSEHYNIVAKLLKEDAPKDELKKQLEAIRLDLNPNPANQMANVPELDGVKIKGLQHKYDQTCLVFPQQGQTCHAYCTFCFRWAQFVLNDFKHATKDAELLIKYLKQNPQITDLLFTGGDPAVMKTKHFELYINAILEADIPHLKNIRIGTKALTYWPYRFTTDEDADDLIALLKKVVDSGLNISVMAHFNHYRALDAKPAQDAIKRLQSVGVQIRSQSPVMRNINDKPEVWSTMWQKMVDLGVIPYYMFIARDTGAQGYFAVPLARAHDIFTKAYNSVSGICRTVRGPSMSCEPGKVHIVGTSEVNGEKVFVLNFIQGRSSEWVNKPFFAKYDPDALWISDLKPAFGEDKFFYEK